MERYSKDDIVGLPRLKDEKKQWAVKLMVSLVPYAFMVSPLHLPVLASRIINILLKNGSCKEAAFGLSTYSICAIALLHDIETGYSYGKISVALLESFNTTDSLLPNLRILADAFVNYFVEPIQSAASGLLHLYEESRAAGNNSDAFMALHNYCQHSIMSGCYLPEFEKQSKEFAIRSLRLQQLQYCRSILSEHNLALALTGNAERKKPFDLLGDDSIVTEDDFLNDCLSSSRTALAQVIYFKRMFVSFWLKKYNEAIEFAERYRSHDRTASARFLYVYHSFYEGLTAFELSRRSTDDAIKLKWVGIGERSIDRYKVWQKHSKWNFENKLLLLQSQCHRCRGEYDDSESKFQAAIESARLHRFVHEEGLARELYSSFLSEKGAIDKSKEELLLAIECYERWGASAVVNLVRQSIAET